MKRLLVALASAAVVAVFALPAGAASPTGPQWGTGGSAPGKAQVGIQSTTIGTDVNMINGSFNQGWWSTNAVNGNSNTNYFVGNTDINFPVQARNYFTFDITALSAHPCATPQSARLTMDAGEGNQAFYGLGPLFVTYRLYGVTTDPFVLSQKNNNPDAAIFGDLGSGPIYGSYTLPTFTSGGTFGLTLNATALNAIAAAKANGVQYFSFGGSLVPQPLIGGGEVFVMGATGFSPAQLTVNWPFLCRIRPPA